MDHLTPGVPGQPHQHGETPSLQKISQEWWHVPTVPATGEAEVGGSLEPEGRGCSEPSSRHYTPAWVTERDSVSKKKKNKSLTQNKRTDRCEQAHFAILSLILLTEK